MKRQDLVFALVVIIVFLPFILFPEVYAWYKAFNAGHGIIMSFIKFAVLSTMGEMLGLRISTGVYNYQGFGLFPRMVVWGVLGVIINFAMILFSTGTPVVLEYIGLDNATALMSLPLSWSKVWVAFSVSVAMNSFFGPVFMTFHKISDTHILQCGGSWRSLVTPIPMSSIITTLNWNVQWNFVFKKTIPLFWFPAHTVTFLLPPEARVLCAALLGVALGVILAVSARKR